MCCPERKLGGMSTTKSIPKECSDALLQSCHAVALDDGLGWLRLHHLDLTEHLTFSSLVVYPYALLLGTLKIKKANNIRELMMAEFKMEVACGQEMLEICSGPMQRQTKRLKKEKGK